MPSAKKNKIMHGCNARVSTIATNAYQHAYARAAQTSKHRFLAAVDQEGHAVLCVKIGTISVRQAFYTYGRDPSKVILLKIENDVIHARDIAVRTIAVESDPPGDTVGETISFDSFV